MEFEKCFDLIPDKSGRMPDTNLRVSFVDGLRMFPILDGIRVQRGNDRQGTRSTTNRHPSRHTPVSCDYGMMPTLFPRP